MQDIATKVEGSQLTAEEFNQIPSELENTITSTGQSLSSADVRQLVKAIAIYAAKGDFYNTAGTADAIVLNSIDSMQAPNAYYLGMKIRFLATANNTKTVTIALGSLSTVQLLDDSGNILPANSIVSGKEYSATFDGNNFRLFAAGSSSLPSIDGESGKFLTNDGRQVFWGEVDLSVKADKSMFQTVDELPSVPSENVYYFVKE